MTCIKASISATRTRLEAYSSHLGQEEDDLLVLDSVTLESLLIEYGSSAQIAASSAVKKMRLWGRSMLSEEKIADVIESTHYTLGQSCLEAERQYLHALLTK